MKRFLSIFLLSILLMWGFIIFDYSKSKIPKELIEASKLTKLSSIALKSYWYEPRLLNLEKDKNIVYPTLPTPNRFNFLYKEQR
jgi:hypothetical protein